MLDEIKEKLTLELHRAKEVKRIYESSQEGLLATWLLQMDINFAENAIKKNEVLDMIRALAELNKYQTQHSLQHKR